MSGKLIYKVADGNRLRQLNLTVCHDEDLKKGNISEVRRKRIIRLLKEAMDQGARLTYRDLNLILLSSVATLKRDISYLRKQGAAVFIGNCRRTLQSADHAETIDGLQKDNNYEFRKT